MAQIIAVRSGGDLATGVVQKFFRAGLRVVILETSAPTAIRRSVALSEAVYNGAAQVEDVLCQKVDAVSRLDECWKAGCVPLLVDQDGESLCDIAPAAVIDAILAKRNTDTHMGMAAITIALGPGFEAGKDVHAVIETMRGHDLGRLILSGSAAPNTGTPGEIGGKSTERVLRAPSAGILTAQKKIGDVVDRGEPVFTVGGQTVRAPFTGLLRGILRDGMHIPSGMKAADLDPRTDIDVHTISDKARCLGGAALEAYFYLLNRGKRNNAGHIHTNR